MFGLKQKLAATVAAAALALGPGMAGAESLADALVAAYKNSRLLEQNRALLAAADENVAQSVSKLRPVLTFTANYYKQRTLADEPTIIGGYNLGRTERFNEQTTAQLSLQLMLWDFGRTRAGIETAKENVLAARAGLVGVEQTVLLDAVQAYVNYRLTLEIQNLRRNYVHVIDEELKATRDRFEVGEVTRTDVALAESQLAEARASMASADGNVQVARETYKAKVGHFPGTLAALPRSPKLPASREDALALARQQHPDMVQQRHLVRAADLNIEVAKAEMRPTLSATGTLGASGGPSQQDMKYDSQRIGVTMSHTLYQGGLGSAQLRQAQMQREAQRAALHQISVEIEQNLGAVWAQLAVSAAQIDANIRQIEAATVAFQGLREEAKLGARTTLEVLDAEQDVLDARAARVETEAQSYFNVYQILAATGKLTAKDLNLGIPTYDVTGYYNFVKDAPAVSFQGESLDRVLKALGKN